MKEKLTSDYLVVDGERAKPMCVYVGDVAMSQEREDEGQVGQ